MHRFFTHCSALLFFILAFCVSLETYAQNCNGADGISDVGGGLLKELEGEICANFGNTPGRMRIEANNVNDQGNPAAIGFRIDWGDGTTQDVTFAGGQVTHPAANTYQAVVTHLFPPTGPNVRCEYTPTVNLTINGVPCPNSLGIPPRFVRWNTDNQNNGVLVLNETATNVNEYLVCRGTTTTVTFTDRSTLNCTPDAYTNDRRRWRRFVYGTTNTITSATGVRVDGVVQTYPFNVTGTPLNTNTAGVRNPPNPTQTLPITIPADAKVGEVFEITMQYWNWCNRYDEGRAPVEITARIRVVDQPPPPPVVNNVVCAGTNPLPAFQTTVTETPTVTWYRDNGGVPGAIIGTPGASKTLAASSYPGGITNTVPGVYRVWVSYNAVGNASGVACESEKVPVTLTITESLAQPAAISGTSDICNGQSAIFTLPASAGSTANGGDTEYEWSSTGGAGVTLTGTTATTATFNINIAGAFETANRTIRVRRKYSSNHSGSGCPSDYRTFPIVVYGTSQGGTVAGGGNFCQGADVGTVTLSGYRGTIQRWEVSTNGGASYSNTGFPATNTISPGVLPAGNYLYRAVVANGPCAEANSTPASFTVSANPTPASTGADQALCTAVLTSAALGGSDPSPGTGEWSVVNKPAAATFTFNSGVNARNTTFSASQVGTYVLRWTVTNGTCVSSADVVVDFGTDPGAQTAGSNTSVCGTSYTLNGSTPTIGTGTWTLQSGPAGGTVSFDNPNLPNATVTLTGTPVFGAYNFRWTVRSGTCTPRFANVAITFSRPATATVPANFTTCVDGTTLAPIDLTGTVGDGAGATQRGRWEIVSGTGSFTSNNSNPGTAKVGPTITDSYKPSAGDFAAGSVQLRLVATDPDGALPCGNVNSSTLVITFDRVPTNVNAGPDQLLLCGPTATLAALNPTNGTGAWSDPNGAGVLFTDANDRATTISNLPEGTTTLRWTVSSTLGVCSSVSSDVVLTRNPLPSVNNLLPEVCEITAGSGLANNIVLTDNDNDVTGGAANTSVEWFTDAGPAGPIVPASTPQNLNDAVPSSLTFFTRVTNSVTTCQNTGTVIYVINPLPVADPFTKSFCEDFPVGSNKVDNIDLNAADIIAGVTGGAANRAVTWFTDAAATTNQIATPGDYDIVGSNVVYARIRNTITNCENVARVDLVIKPRPFDQPIQGKSAVCVDALELYQVNPVATAQYQWTIPPQFTKFLGGDPTDFLSLVSFPTVATGDIKLTIVVNGCAGNELVKPVAVSPTPTPFTINVPGGAICENEIGVPFSVTPSNYPSSNYNWEIDPPGGALVSTGQTTGNVLINFLTSDVTIKVTESNASNCAGPPQQTTVVIRQRPSLADLTNEVCSEDDAGIILQESALSVVPAANYNITSVAVDPGLIPLSGPTSGIVGANAIALDRFENPTGGVLRVRYTVEPLSADGCEGPAKIVQLTVKPEPLLDVTTPVPVCSSTPLGRVLTVVSGSVPADFFIIDSVVPDAGLTAGAGNPLNLGQYDKNVLLDDVWINQTSAPLTVTYNIRPYNSVSDCAGTPALPLTFTIYPEPLVTPDSKAICSGDDVDLALTSGNIAGANFSWTVKSVTAGITGAAPGVGTSIHDILTNTTGAPGTVVYTVVARNPAALLNCQGPGEDITITVNPAPPVVNISETMCSDAPGGNTMVEDLTSLEATINSGGGVTFEWYSDAALTNQIVPPALTAYSMINNVSVYAKVDNGICFNTATVTYVINPSPQVTTNVTLHNGFGVSCNGDTNGQIIANASSGSSPYLYSIDGGTNFFATPTFNLLAPGSYTVTVKDNKNCVANSTLVDITEPPVLTINGTATDALCRSGNTGQITITSGGGVAGSHAYSLNGSAFQASNTFGSLAAGTYTITVRDGNNCTKSTTVVVSEPDLLTGSITDQTNVACNGQANGEVTVIGNGGVGGYQYAIDGVNFQTSGTFGSLPAGPYTITVRDANNCITTVPVVITQPAVLTLNLNVKADASCNGDNDGSLTVSGFGGTAPYEFSIDGVVFQSGNTFASLTAGTYTITVRDSHQCTSTLSVTINQPPALGGSVTSQTNVLCNGTSTGTVTVNGSGGTGTYQFSLNGGAFGNSGTFGSLAAGSYVVTVRDQNNCTFDVPVTITEPAVLAGNLDNQTNVSCHGGNDGTAVVSASGGVLPYQFSINGGGTFVPSGTFGGLAAGSYTIIVRDANLCIFNVPVTITEPAALTGGVVNKLAVDCKGNATGEVTVEGLGGTAPYEYSIDGSTFQASGTFTGLTAGNYVIRIRDAESCSFNVPTTITEPPLLVLAIQGQVNVDCNGNSTGSVMLQGQGGVGGYTFSDDNTTFVASATFGGLAAGSHTFYTRDLNGCVAQVTAVITEPPVLVLALGSKTDVLCNGQNTGSFTVTASGGAGSYEYSIDGVMFTPVNVFGGLTAGTYTITVRDANNCTTTLTETIAEPLPITGAITQTADVLCFLGTDAELTVAASGGTGDLNYQILQDPGNITGFSSGVFSGIRAGAYTVRITDQNFCRFTTAPITVTQPDQLKVSAAVTSSFNGYHLSCDNAADAVIEASVTGGTGPGFTYSISPDPNSGGTNNNGVFNNLPAGLYTITVHDANSCAANSLPVIINPPFPMSPGFVGFDQFVCIDKDPAEISSIVPPFGGTEDYIFQWQQSTDNVTFNDIPGANLSTYDPPLLAQTTFFKRVVTLASGGCGAIESNVVKITINPLPTVNITPSPAVVCEGDLLFVNLQFTGQAPYHYDYTATNIFGTTTFTNQIGGANTPIPVFNYHETTTYRITKVVDFNGCEINPGAVEVTVPVSKIDANFTIVSPAAQCSGSTFEFEWNVDADIQYTFLWSDGSQDIVAANSRPVGPQRITHVYNLPVAGGSTFIPIVLKAENVVNGCGPKQTMQSVEIYPSVLVALPPVDNTICSGETINFDNVTDGASIHKWYYRVKGTSDQNEIRSDFKPSYTFVTQGNDNPTTYEVVYEGSNAQGCMDSRAMDIIVYRNSVASFDEGTVPPFIGGSSSVNFTNTSTIIDATDFSYTWDFGVGATPEDAADHPGPVIPVTYSSPGVKKITLTVINRTEPACRTTYSETFTIVVPPLTADFTVFPLASCVPTTIEVNNTAGGADKFIWVLEDENGVELAASNLTQPAFDITQAGKYTITLVATLTSTNQTATKSVSNIEVYPKPQAIFTARPKVFFVPDTEVDLLNDSQGANEFHWKFGDGRESIDREPFAFTYTLEGLYKIELEARYNHGMKDLDGDGVPDVNVTCADTASQIVTAKEGGATKIPNAFTPSLHGPTGGTAVDNGSALNDTFLPITSGVQEFLMQIFDRWGNLIFESKDKNVGWDGYDKNGRLMPAGVYVFKLILRLADDQRETRIGDVTLIR